MHAEIPTANDADARLHEIILIFAGSTLVTVGLTFAGRRAFTGLARVLGANLLSRPYKAYFKIHAYFWIPLIIALAGHLTASYIHVGIWPSVLN